MTNSSDLTQTVKEHASDLGAQARTAAEREIAAQAEKAKHAAASQIEDAAKAADAAAAEFDPNSPQVQAVHRVADSIEEAALRLRGADINELTQRTTEFARRNPVLFLGGAAIAGFALARFMNARAPQPQRGLQSHAADPWADFETDAEPHWGGANDV